MDYVGILKQDLEKGFKKSDLERLIGLPKNNLSGILKGDRKLSRQSQIKIENWQKSNKPDPLNLSQIRLPKIQDLTNHNVEITPITDPSPTSNITIATQRIAEIEGLLTKTKYLNPTQVRNLKAELSKLKKQS